MSYLSSSPQATLGVNNPGPALTKAWDHLSGLDDAQDALRIKQVFQGLTRGERKKFKALGAACLATHQVVDALIDARDGVFNPPMSHSGYGF